MIPGAYAYLFLCGLYFLVWCAFFVARKDLRKELLVISMCAAPLGLTEYLYFDYFRPDFFFPLLPRIGGEDFLWAGIVSGIGAVSYEVIAKRKNYRDRKLSPGWLGEVWLSITVVLGLAILYTGTTFFFVSSANLSIIGFFLIGLTIIAWRFDLFTSAVLSGTFLTIITFVVYSIWIVLFPSAFTDYWVLENTFGITINNIPIEELMYAFGWGMVIGPMYELMAGLRFRKVHEVTYQKLQNTHKSK